LRVAEGLLGAIAPELEVRQAVLAGLGRVVGDLRDRGVVGVDARQILGIGSR
jgi:hypothetical protein